MKQQDALGTKDFEYRLSFDGHAPVLQDHFPHLALVPAYMQLAAIRSHAALYLQCTPTRVSIQTIKFLRPLLPDRPVALRFERRPKPGALRYELKGEEGVVTHGDILFG
jgi:3-hydroxymyristoyl/3-hydroxydecanoyl-(acyl carrier protein) dehydratase